MRTHNQASIGQFTSRNMPDTDRMRFRGSKAVIVNIPDGHLSIPGSNHIAPIEARFYESKSGSTVVCKLWLHNPDYSIHRYGYGRAFGYGYHHDSAALAAAIASAGLDLRDPIDGRGDYAMRDALLAIAGALGWRDATIMEFHP